MALPIFQTKLQEFSLMQTAWASVLNPLLKRFASNSTSSNIVQEYVWNSGNVTAAGGSDTSSFGYGAQGTPFLAYDSLTLGGATTFTCRFKTPIDLDTDFIFLEILQPNTSVWLEVNYTGLSLFYANTAVYGAAVAGSTSNKTDVIVEFANGGINANGCTYGGVGGFPWSVIAGTYRWRVRKASFS